MNQITIELCAEDRARLDKLLSALEHLSAEPKPAEPALTLPLEEVEHPVDNPFEAAPAQTYKLADVQQKVVQLSAKGRKADVRDIVKAYADKVSAIPEAKMSEVMEKLLALEAG